MPGRDLLLSPVLRGEPVAVEVCDDGAQVVRYGPLKLGTISVRGRFVRGARTRRRESNDEAEELSSGTETVELIEMVESAD